jgi:hypothetical protein
MFDFKLQHGLASDKTALRRSNTQNRMSALGQKRTWFGTVVMVRDPAILRAKMTEYHTCNRFTLSAAEIALRDISVRAERTGAWSERSKYLKIGLSPPT